LRKTNEYSLQAGRDAQQNCVPALINLFFHVIDAYSYYPQKILMEHFESKRKGRVINPKNYKVRFTS
jgi:hypothetical protein